MTYPLTCTECRDHLSAYVDADHRDLLHTRLRRRIGAHLDTCPACDTIYRARRDVARELRTVTPLIGRADAPRLGAIWAAVQSELAAPRRVRRLSGRASMQYGAVVFTLLLVLVLPLVLGGQPFTFALPVPPTPIIEAEATEASTAALSAAGSTAAATPAHTVALLDERPTMPPQPRYAPTEVATDIP